MAKSISHAARGHIGVLVRRGADPEDIEAARAELKAVMAEEYIQRLVAEAPPITETQRAKLAAILVPVPVEDGGRVE